MANVRLDRVLYSSFYEAFRNRQVVTGSVVLSGVIPTGHSTFSTTIPITRNSAVFEIYHQVPGSPRRRLDSSTIVLDVNWTHNVYVWVRSSGANAIEITIDVDNPDVPDTIPTQTVNFYVHVFDTPF